MKLEKFALWASALTVAHGMAVGKPYSHGAMALSRRDGDNSGHEGGHDDSHRNKNDKERDDGDHVTRGGNDNPNGSGSGQDTTWQNLKCDQFRGGDPQQQWHKAGVPDAWKSVKEAWNSSHEQSGFPQFVSGRLHGPDGMRCEDIGVSNNCDNPVRCEDVGMPAGALLLNSFVALHETHAQAKAAIDTVHDSVSSNIGTFTETFLPNKKDDSQVWKNVIDGLVMGFSIGASVIFNKVWTAASVLQGVAHDSVLVGIGDAAAFAKDNGFPTQDLLGKVNSMSTYLGALTDSWKQFESSYLEDIFSGTEDSINRLEKTIAYGGMNRMINDLHLNTAVHDLEKVLYGQLLTAAWRLDRETARPFVWASGLPCGHSVPPETTKLMEPSTATKTNVCFDRQLYFLLNAQGGPMSKAGSLPGADLEIMDGKNWGGLTLLDIVISAVRGWQNNNKQNGVVKFDVEQVFQDQGKRAHSVQDPGFFGLPVCDQNATTISDVISGVDRGSKPNYPCMEAPNYNHAGTNIHVDKGCIVIGEGQSASKRCAGGDPYNVSDKGDSENSSATIYAGFHGDNTLDFKVVPDCKIEASWPRTYGDVWFNEANCLHDSENNKIACCEGQPANRDSVLNPYKEE